MNLDNRISALEAEAGRHMEPLCIFLVALGAEEHGRRIVGFEASGQTWVRGGAEPVGTLKARVVTDLRAMGVASPLVVTRYAEAV